MTVTNFDVVHMSKDHNSQIRYKTAVRSRKTLYEKENSVALRYSVMYMGRNKHSQKLWSRWEPLEMCVVRRTSTGKFACFGRDLSTGKVRGGVMPPTFYDNDVFYDACAKIGFKDIGDAYPALRVFKEEELSSTLITRVKSVAPGNKNERRKFYASLHNDDPRVFIANILGTYRKDIARSLNKVSVSEIDVLSEAYKHIPVDWLAQAISANHPRNLKSVAILNTMVERGHLSQTQVRDLIFNGELSSDSTTSDAARMARRLENQVNIRELTRGKNVEDIHDELTSIFNGKRATAQAAPIKYAKEIAQVMDAEVGKYRIVLPKNGNEIVRWGRDMGHCIGSYSDSAYVDDVLGAVYDGDNMVANFQIRDKQMVQIYGKHNSIFDGAVEVRDYFLDKKLIKDTGYIGGINGLF